MIVDCAVYQDGRRRDGHLRLEDAFRAGRDDGAFVWIGLHEPTEQEFDSVRREFGLHELAVEDAIKAHQRPKLEIYGDTLFVVLKPATYHDDRDEIELGETLLFVGEGFIVSVRHGEATALAEVRRAVESEPERLRCGPDAVLHAIVDRVVDDYLPVAQASRRTSRRSRPPFSRPSARTRRSGSSSSSARCSSSQGRPARSSSPSTGSAGRTFPRSTAP